MLAGLVYNQLLSACVFLGCMLLVGLTILTQGLKVRPAGVEIGVGLGLVVVYLMVFFRLTLPERSHLIEYGVLAVFVYEALAERKSNGRRVPVPAVLAIVATSLVGTIDEFIQFILPSRYFEWTDLLFNCLAALMAVTAIVVLGWVRGLAQTLLRHNE